MMIMMMRKNNDAHNNHDDKFMTHVLPEKIIITYLTYVSEIYV